MSLVQIGASHPPILPQISSRRCAGCEMYGKFVESKVCGKCKVDKPRDCFWRRGDRGPHSLTSFCKDCHNTYYRENREKYKHLGQAWVEKNRPKVNEYSRKHKTKTRARLDELKSAPCMDCGNTFPAVCMDFDHRPGEKKTKLIAKMISFAEDKLLAEIAKCDLVCSNCHRIRTRDRLKEVEVAA